MTDRVDPDTDLGRRIRDNIAAVRDRIAAACSRAGRDPATVRLVAVTKYVAADVTRLVLEAGLVDLAESRPQAIWTKAAALATARPAPRWHLIGHLQRNKVRRTLPLLAMLQSLDSLRLLEAIEADADRERPGDHLPVLVEVNLTDDPGRSGAAWGDVPALVRAAAASPRVRLCGLMGMAGHPDAAQADARRDFARLRFLRDELAATLPDPAALAELSMGMSGDYEAAILEGATIVRIGSALFEGVA
ncbi:MAG: YggS family pyridoxal phosphate-dependent enzyme [Planctomycetia bacterium]